MRDRAFQNNVYQLPTKKIHFVNNNSIVGQDSGKWNDEDNSAEERGEIGRR